MKTEIKIKKLESPILKKDMELTILSPVFIGDGKVVLGDNKEEDAVRKLIDKDKHLTDRWVNYFMNTPKPKLTGFLKDINPAWGVKKTYGFISEAEKIYIPGSSIKGAIRTAVLTEIILRNIIPGKATPNKVEELLEQLNLNSNIEGSLRNIMRCIIVSDASMDKIELIKTKVENQNILDLSKKPKTLDHNVRQFLNFNSVAKFTISIDETISELILPDYSDIFNSVSSLLNVVNKHYSLLLEETEESLGKVKPQTVKEVKPLTDEEKKAQRKIIEDKALIERFGNKPLRNIPYENQKPILDDCKKKYPYLYSKTNEIVTSNDDDPGIKVYNKKCNLKPNINIGGQSGFNSKVVLRALAGNDIDKYIKMKKTVLQSKFPAAHHITMPKAPRYLKIANNYTIGWCNIQEVGRIC